MMGCLILWKMPISCVGLLFGCISIENIAMTTLFLLVSAFAALSVGVMCSVFFKRTVTAAIIAYAMLFLIGIGTLVPLFFGLSKELVKLIESGGVTIEQVIRVIRGIPQSVWFNPGVGLIAVVDSQTNLLMGAIENFGMHTIFKAFGESGMLIVAWINMAASTVLAMVFTLISAMCLRVRSTPLKRGRRKEKKV